MVRSNFTKYVLLTSLPAESDFFMEKPIQVILLPSLPRKISGLRKDGKPDKRVRFGLIQISQLLEKATGISAYMK